MAKQDNKETKTFDKELQTDVSNFHEPTNSWDFARNAINNSVSGDLGSLGNEPANLLCIRAPYTIIGTIHLNADRWIIFSTNNVDSEIGLYTEGVCSYSTVVNDQCLGLNTKFLITGVSKGNADCTTQIYWQDALNPDRTMTVEKPPFKCVDTNLDPDCIECIPDPLLGLDCEKIRLAGFVEQPCLRVERGITGGEILNGSYYVVTAYTINGGKVTDYSTPSIIQPIFFHNNVSGSLDIYIDKMDTNHFSEFELVLVSTINQQTSARKVGIYSTHQQIITLDIIDNRWISVPIAEIPIRNQIVDKSDGIYENGPYMLRVGPYSKFDFNYQPLANQIGAKWQSVEYPADYYRKGGNQTSYMRDEQYSFFIRWVYNTGDKSNSSNIAGRPAKMWSNICNNGISISEVALSPITDDQIFAGEQVFEVYNTATITNNAVNILAPDGVGLILSEGEMGYWESTERYPDNNPQVWNSTFVDVNGVNIGNTTNTQYDLCGKAIRHHKFPDNALHPTTNHYNPGGTKIRLMAVVFDNIQRPVDNNNLPILNIVGYEILRGSREGNKTVIAKGMLNNLGEYDFNVDGDQTISSPIGGVRGYYPNFPYNDTSPDPFISTQQTTTGAIGCLVQNNVPLTSFPQDKFTFHSPDTQFRKPFLSMPELKIYGELNCDNNFADSGVEGYFLEPNGHPKHKLITNFAFLTATIAGIGIAILAANGTKRTTTIGVRSINLGGVWVGPTSGTQPIGLGVAGTTASTGTNTATIASTVASEAGGELAANMILSQSSSTYYNLIAQFSNAAGVTPGTLGSSINTEYTSGSDSSLPTPLKIFANIGMLGATYSYYFANGTDATLELIKAILPYRQYALAYQSHAFYNYFQDPICGYHRFLITDKPAIYLEPHLQDWNTGARVNNLFRAKSVVLDLTNINIPNRILPGTILNDNSKQTVGTANSQVPPLLASFDKEDVVKPFKTSAASHYGALKQRLRNQYGQLDGILQVPVSTCPQTINPQSVVPYSSPTIFGGDTYVSRYTEKNTMFFFYDWLFNQPDGFEFDYNIHQNIPHPTYWANTIKFETFDFFGGVVSNILNPLAWSTFLPSGRFALDRNSCPLFAFGVKESYFYLFNSGVRDFFVESEINTDFRDWGEDITQQHYDYLGLPSSNLRALFETSIIKSGNFYKYDISLSASRIYNNFISWGNIQSRYYDPFVSEFCYIHKPKRIIYSLPNVDEQIYDNWLLFLPNNYKDFKSRPVIIKPISKNGAIILFENESPVQFIGVDVLQTDTGTKITIGDGGLFSQPLQNITNADRPYEYASCQNARSVINTPMGLFWISENQGKIFQLAGNSPKEITMSDNKWWFATYLPYQLLIDFPTYDLKDNPVVGIGCQSIYNNEDGLVYFCKRDFKLRKLPAGITLDYLGANIFAVMQNGQSILTVGLDDKTYFEDASWTISYDPKTGSWIGWHDWHPELCIPGKNTFMTTQTDAVTGQGGVWIHNKLSNLYCNYYGVDFPFELEFRVHTGQTVQTLQSIEYIMEVYKYAQNSHDRYHVLDFNFDEAVVHNTEQVSGLLKLNLSPENDPFLITKYPITNFSSIDILFSKVENKYRFDQFDDITDDRGQFTNAERMIWNTEANGYIKVLNPANLNYAKSPFQRKPFRHYQVSVFLRRKVCGQNKILLMIQNVRNQVSPR